MSKPNIMAKVLELIDRYSTGDIKTIAELELQISRLEEVKE